MSLSPVFFTLKTQMEHVGTRLGKHEHRCLCQGQLNRGSAWVQLVAVLAAGGHVYTMGGQRASGIANAPPQLSPLPRLRIQHEQRSPSSWPSATIGSLLRPGHGALSQDGWAGSRLAESSRLEMDISSCDIWASACPPSWTLCQLLV